MSVVLSIEYQRMDRWFYPVGEPNRKRNRPRRAWVNQMMSIPYINYQHLLGARPLKESCQQLSQGRSGCAAVDSTKHSSTSRSSNDGSIYLCRWPMPELVPNVFALLTIFTTIKFNGRPVSHSHHVHVLRCHLRPLPLHWAGYPHLRQLPINTTNRSS